VERAHVLPKKSAMVEGDVVIGVASSGLHSNGFSLVRRVVADAGAAYDKPAPFDAAHTLGDAVLAPTRLYVKSSLAAIHAGGVKGLAHITGGGITENLPRILPDGLAAEIDLARWAPPAVFGWLAHQAGIVEREMLRTFNCGLGLIAIVAAESAGHVIDAFQECGEKAMRVGSLVAADGEAKVVYKGALKL
jgi:phosphoribosylformylglycinamidine cyclo-ligase